MPGAVGQTQFFGPWAFAQRPVIPPGDENLPIGHRSFRCLTFSLVAWFLVEDPFFVL